MFPFIFIADLGALRRLLDMLWVSLLGARMDSVKKEADGKTRRMHSDTKSPSRRPLALKEGQVTVSHLRLLCLKPWGSFTYQAALYLISAGRLLIHFRVTCLPRANATGQPPSPITASAADTSQSVHYDLCF